MMRIGFDSKRAFHNTTGLGNYSRDSVRLLSQYFPENKYLLYTPKPGKVKFHHNKENTSIVLPKKPLHRILSSYWRVKLMVNQLREDNLDIYFGLSNELPNGIEKTNIKTVVSIHDLIFIRYPEFYSKIDRKIYEYKFHRACQVSDQIVAISNQTRDDILNFWNIPKEKIEVVYQGCNAIFQKHIPQEVKESLAKKYDLPKRFVLYVGSIEQRKNLLTLVKAMQDLKSEKLIVVGRKTSYYNEVKAYIHKLGMMHRVRFFFNLPFEELPAFYQLADLFVYPSYFEGFGIPIIEALFSKTPVISSTGSCFSESGGPDTIYVDPNDSKSLSEAINEVMTNTTLREHMILKGYNYAERFKDETVAQNLFKVLESTLR